MRVNKNIVYVLICTILFISQFVKSQDTTIVTPILTSKFSCEYHNPLHVSYKLYQGGGDCDRSKFSFKTGGLECSAKSKNYSHSGYDIGHCAPAEDFAFDCIKDSMTFFYYNAMPQTPNLNRGIWRFYENIIRKQSQTDSLLIICGGIYGEATLQSKSGNTEIRIPIYCWKVVKSLTTNRIYYCLLFTNNLTNNTVQTLSVQDLEKLIGYELVDF